MDDTPFQHLHSVPEGAGMSILDFLPTVAKIIDKVIPDRSAAAAAQAALAQATLNGQLSELDNEFKLTLAQIDVDKTEASNPSIFVSGWRPFVGWVCGAGLAYQFLFRPIATGISNAAGHPIEFPSLDMGTLMTLLGGLLGFGAMRTTEKIQGVSRS
jgi:hypothetical protein